MRLLSFNTIILGLSSTAVQFVWTHHSLAIHLSFVFGLGLLEMKLLGMNNCLRTHLCAHITSFLLLGKYLGMTWLDHKADTHLTFFTTVSFPNSYFTCISMSSSFFTSLPIYLSHLFFSVLPVVMVFCSLSLHSPRDEQLEFFIYIYYPNNFLGK